MSKSYRIHPSIGVARLGNSPDEFYLAPESVGGMPLRCDRYGNDGIEGPAQVRSFKDSVGRVKRQAARFRILDDDDNEINLSSKNVLRIRWTVHIANKKPIWYTFSELQGDLEFGEGNSYENQHIPKNNPDKEGAERKKLMIDPGPRSIEGSKEEPGTPVELSRYNIPEDYPHGSFPPPGSGGSQIDSLGELRMNQAGHLIALGGFGNVTGSGHIASFRGAGGYWDDVADGYVLATIHFWDVDGGEPETVVATPAWLLVGSPKYAPELVNITTLWDTAYDTAIRFLKADPEIYDEGKYDDATPFLELGPDDEYTPLRGYNPDYVVDFDTQVMPIIQRMQSYRWVADVPYLNDFAHPPFFPLLVAAEYSDKISRDDYKEEREKYFRLFRMPVLPQDYDKWIHRVRNGPNQLASGDEGIPLMPLNSGDNSVTNDGPIYKFETLSPTQYFFLHQWAVGKFEVGGRKQSWAERLDEASIGNCVGAPFSPGIETTWITRNHKIYGALARLRLAHFEGGNEGIEAYYRKHGLSDVADEAEGKGCEPGDLTKRMAIPWQSDFQECTVQTPNITDPAVNQFADGTGIEVPPAYYVYWWPPQSPMHVVTGDVEPQNQVLDAFVSGLGGPIVAAGQRVPYQRGIDSPESMIDNWSRMGFIVDQGPRGYPYFVETERDHGALAQYRLIKEQKRLAMAKAKG